MRPICTQDEESKYQYHAIKAVDSACIRQVSAGTKVYYLMLLQSERGEQVVVRMLQDNKIDYVTELVFFNVYSYGGPFMDYIIQLSDENTITTSGSTLSHPKAFQSPALNLNVC